MNVTEPKVARSDSARSDSARSGGAESSTSRSSVAESSIAVSNTSISRSGTIKDFGGKPISTDAPYSTETLSALAELAARAAHSAGDFVAEMLNNTRIVTTKSRSTDFVTEMDKVAEQLIVSMIQQEREGDAIYSEEGTSRQGTTGFSWLIDPIDGTTNYVCRHPIFSVSVGVEHNGVVIAGAVAIPVLASCIPLPSTTERFATVEQYS
jgi:Inositol monophosphatase family